MDTQYDFVPLQPKHIRLSGNTEDALKLRFIPKRNAQGDIVSYTMHIMLGANIAKIMGLSKGDIMAICPSQTNPRKIQLKKAADSIGWRMQVGANTPTVLNTQLIWKQFVPAEAEFVTRSVKWDVLGNTVVFEIPRP